MRFTGRNLAMVKQGLELALDEIHNQIATCPDVNHYERELADLAAEQTRFRRLLEQVKRSPDLPAQE